MHPLLNFGDGEMLPNDASGHDDGRVWLAGEEINGVGHAAGVLEAQSTCNGVGAARVGDDAVDALTAVFVEDFARNENWGGLEGVGSKDSGGSAGAIGENQGEVLDIGFLLHTTMNASGPETRGIGTGGWNKRLFAGSKVSILSRGGVEAGGGGLRAGRYGLCEGRPHGADTKGEGKDLEQERPNARFYTSCDYRARDSNCQPSKLIFSRLCWIYILY